jgi:predicted nucleotidyltransferase
MERKIRLSERDLKTIVETAKEVFGNCKVYLFGSRTDPDKRGGDIDLLVVLDSAPPDEAELDFLAKLRRKGILRKVDLLTLHPGKKMKPIHKTALEEGIRIL